MHKTFSTDGSNSIGKWYPRTCLEKSFVIDSENILKWNDYFPYLSTRSTFDLTYLFFVFS